MVRFENGRAEVLGNLAEDMTFDNAVGFDVTEAYRYVSEPTREGGRTLRYGADAATGEWSLDRIIEGYMVDDNTFYQSRILGEQIVGPVCEITIRDADGRVKDTITLHAENIAGAQYLGKNQAGMHLVKQLDMVTHEDGTCSVEETIRTVSAEG